MNFERSASPANLAFKNLNFNRNCIASILPPYIGSKSGETDGNKEYENLKEFRTRILEMDDEIKHLRNLESDKELSQLKSYYQSPECLRINKLKLKDECVSTTESLLDEQDRRLEELVRQFDQLTKETYKTNCQRISNEDRYFEQSNMDGKRMNYDNDLDKEVSHKIGDWTPKDPYRGPMQNLYFPFGSSGGGAPRRDSDGNIQTTIIGKDTFDINPEERRQKVLAHQVLQEEQKQDIIQHRLYRLQDKQEIRAPNGNFSDVISNLRAGRPKKDPITGILIDNHLSSSDVTNIKLASPRSPPSRFGDNTHNLNESENLTYGMELTRAARERKIMRHLDKLREDQESRQHLESWNNIWGPRDRSDMKKRYYFNNPNQRMISNHRNFYQIPMPMTSKDLRF